MANSKSGPKGAGERWLVRRIHKYKCADFKGSAVRCHPTEEVRAISTRDCCFVRVHDKTSLEVVWPEERRDTLTAPSAYILSSTDHRCATKEPCLQMGQPRISDIHARQARTSGDGHKTHPLCVRLILSAMTGAISIVSIISPVACTRSVWSIELVTTSLATGRSRRLSMVVSLSKPIRQC